MARFHQHHGGMTLVSPESKFWLSYFELDLGLGWELGLLELEIGLGLNKFTMIPYN